MRRIVGLQAELIITTALLVGAALLFGGFLLLRVTEQKLIEQQLKHVRSTIQLVGSSLSQDETVDKAVSRGKLHQLLTELDLQLDGWELYDRFMQPVGGQILPDREGRRPVILAQQARFSSGPQLQIEYSAIWLPFAADARGSIESAIALHDINERFAGVVWLQFSLDEVHHQVAEARRLVFLYVLLYGLVLIAFGVVVLSRNVVRPVNRLSAATTAVAAGNLETRVEIDGPREIADLGESFNRMTEALCRGRDELLRSERMASVGHLSAGMAHEVGNPLAAIIGYLELLKADIDDESQRDLVQRSLGETTRIDRLVRDLLDYAAPTGAIADPIDLCNILNATIQSLQSQAAFDGYTITSNCLEALPAVSINPHKLTQVLVNLISNARDASEKGSVINVSAVPEKEEVLISIQDQGAGIDDETRAHIFDPFFSTKREGEGRGLGLTICHRIVEEAGGRIALISDQKSGSTFIVRLPIIDRIQT